ncbi:MAG: ATP-dependent protease ATPase subunit HslU [Eubacteriales bacterium]|nr:ATP-dependent protease ATPase subunit HslU [Eubacteriales bacterium]MDY3332654.1 ATP-dependent protease ATPase subunit HslU [Gallibacter sp.]
MSDLKNMTPREIVEILDKYIIGQDDAKKSVAVALRNRYRRSLLNAELQEEITPKNILMVGPTGVGKTEIARRLAKVMDAPFVKVEATKFTEVGYVGRDVDSMIRDLIESSIRLTKKKRLEEKYGVAEAMVEEKIVDALMPNQSVNNTKRNTTQNPFDFLLMNSNYLSQKEEYEQKKQNEEREKKLEHDASNQYARDQIIQQLRDGKLENEYIEVEVSVAHKGNQLDMSSEGVGIAIGNIFGDMMPEKKKRKKMTVKEAREVLREEEAQKLIDMDQVVDDAIKNAEQNGIIFIDEIDKIASSNMNVSGGGVSREGVQRDILPIVEGSVVNTKHGPVNTNHILFIGAGAFHVAKTTDLIPELQGRFPIRVELETLTEELFLKILTVPENAIIKQHKALLETEGVNIDFTADAIEELAHLAYLMNEQYENIGARRLHTVLENLLEDISFALPNVEDKTIVIDKEYVAEKFKEKVDPEDLDKYII